MSCLKLEWQHWATIQDKSHGSPYDAVGMQKYVKPMNENQIQKSNTFKKIFSLPSGQSYALLKLPVSLQWGKSGDLGPKQPKPK